MTTAEGCWIITHVNQSWEREEKKGRQRDFYLSSAPGFLHSTRCVSSSTTACAKKPVKYFETFIMFAFMIISQELKRRQRQGQRQEKGQTNYSYLNDNWTRGIN